MMMSKVVPKEEQYSIKSAKVIATTMFCINKMILNPDSKLERFTNGQICPFEEFVLPHLDLEREKNRK